jgi:hypothetical protein
MDYNDIVARSAELERMIAVMELVHGHVRSSLDRTPTDEKLVVTVLSETLAKSGKCLRQLWKLHGDVPPGR